MLKYAINLLTQAAQAALHSLPGRGPSVGEVMTEYLSSSKFRSLAPASQEPYRLVLERWVRTEAISERPIRSLGKRDLEAMLAKHSQGAANFLFKRIRVLLRFAMARQYRDDDPTIGIVCKPIGREHATWTDEEIAQFREQYPLGKRERLAFELALNSSQRRGDLARMRWADIRGGRISIVQHKTKTPISIPIHPDLQAALDLVKGPRTGTVLVRTCRPVGKPLTPESLGNLFAEWIEAAGWAAIASCMACGRQRPDGWPKRVQARRRLPLSADGRRLERSRVTPVAPVRPYWRMPLWHGSAGLRCRSWGVLVAGTLTPPAARGAIPATGTEATMAKGADEEFEKVRRMLDQEQKTLRHMKEDGETAVHIERQEQSVGALKDTLRAVGAKLRQSAGGQ